MRVYIDMEMPKPGQIVLVEIDENGDVFAAYDGGRTKLTQHKAVPIPTHGRLIDADALFDFILNIYKTAQGDARKAYRDVLDTIVAAGDVIPAEDGE